MGGRGRGGLKNGTERHTDDKILEESHFLKVVFFASIFKNRKIVVALVFIPVSS